MANQSNTLQLSHLEQTIYFAAQRQGVHVLNAGTVVRMVDVAHRHAANLLASMARKGALGRIGRGRYAVIPPDVLYERKSYVADPHMVIHELMQAEGLVDRYYVGYQSAAAIHGAAHQLPLALLVVVPDQRRPIQLGPARIQFVQIEPAKLFGFQELTYHGTRLNVSDREKTLLDCLERFDLCGGVTEVARTISSLVEGTETGKLLDYLPRMGNQTLVQRLGLILARLGTAQPVDENLIERIAALVGPHTYLLDPHGPAEGAVNPRWRVRENVDVLQDL